MNNLSFLLALSYNVRLAFSLFLISPQHYRILLLGHCCMYFILFYVFVYLICYRKKKIELENRIHDTSGLVKKTNHNTKITEIEGKIPDVSNLATKTALTTVENKIPSVSNLVKKTDYNTKITDIENKLNNHNHDKYIDTSEFNKLAADVFNVRLAQANLITKTDFDAKLSSLNRKITQNKSKHFRVENELNKLTFDSSYFIGESHFGEDGTQN